MVLGEPDKFWADENNVNRVKYPLTKKERERMRIIQAIHSGDNKRCAKEDRWVIIEERTGIGPMHFIKCLKCKKQYDITDYDLW